MAIAGCDESGSLLEDEPGAPVYLTFDDGPGRDTPDLLDALQGAPATFFMLGRNVDANPEFARRVRADGHTIGNHSYTHVDFDQASLERIAQEIDAGGAAIERATGVRTRLFRPPYLSGDAAADQLAIDRGYRVIRGKNTRDYLSDDPGTLTGSVLKHLRSGDVLFFHDSDPTGTASRQVTVEAIRRLIPELRARGFGAKRLT